MEIVQVQVRVLGTCVRPGVAEPDCEPVPRQHTCERVHLHPHPFTRYTYQLTAHQLAATPKLEKFGLVFPLFDDKLMEFQAPPGMASGEEHEFEFTELELLSAKSRGRSCVRGRV